MVRKTSRTQACGAPQARLLMRGTGDVSQIRAKFRRGLIVALGVLCLFGATSALATAGEEEAYVYAGQGKLGKFSRWAAWLERDRSSHTRVSDPCLFVDVVEPPVDGLVSESELRECGAVSRRAPLMQVVVARSDNRNPNTVVAIVAESGMSMLSLDVGRRGRRSLRLRQMSAEEAKELGISSVSYAAHAFPGRLCIEGVALHRNGRAFPFRGRRRPCR